MTVKRPVELICDEDCDKRFNCGFVDLDRTMSAAGRAGWTNPEDDYHFCPEHRDARTNDTPLPPAVHWLTLYDPEDGEPYGEVCECSIGTDHDGSGDES